MGLDLKVLASHFRERRGEMLVTATLRFDRDAGLFEQLTANATPIPDGLKVGLCDDAGLKYTDTDGRGERLTCVTPAEVTQLTVPADTAQWNRAVVAFLSALPAETRIILYWC